MKNGQNKSWKPVIENIYFPCHTLKFRKLSLWKGKSTVRTVCTTNFRSVCKYFDEYFDGLMIILSYFKWNHLALDNQLISWDVVWLVLLSKHQRNQKHFTMQGCKQTEQYATCGRNATTQINLSDQKMFVKF